MGVDYGFGTANIDKVTDIRYGVIPMNDLGSFAWDEISQGEDIDFKNHKDDIKGELEASIEQVLTEHGYDRQNDAGEYAESIVNDLNFDGYESGGDCTRYHYQQDGYDLLSCSDGDLFVQKSPYFTNAPFCSPCAPGAGYLRDGGEMGDCRAYCLFHDWFEDGVAPYPVYLVATGELVLPPAKSY